MVLLSSPTGFLEIAIFLFAVFAFILAVRFFMESRKRLEELFPSMQNSKKLLPFGFDRSGFIIPKTLSKKNENTPNPRFYSTPANSSSDHTKEEIKDLRFALQQQQQELSKALEQIAHISQNTGFSESKTNVVLDEHKKLELLRMQVEKKEAEIQRLKQQESFSQKLQERFKDVQGEFEKLQDKMQKMEQQAWQAADLSMQLEHAEETQLQIEKSLLKKEEKLRELTLENQRLHEAFNEIEDKLSEANLQRQQLQKKVHFLEEVNNDVMQMAEANRKLKNELTRIAELESMLHLITEERDALRMNRR